MTDREILELLLKNQNETNNRLTRIDERLDKIESDIEQLKEDSEITRDAANILIKWADENFPQYPLIEKHA